MADSDDRPVSPRELFVLGVVSRRPIHGHGINRIIEISEAQRWVDISPKHVYYVLRKLAAAGFVEAHPERRGAAPPRRMYAITPSGLETLRMWLKAPGLSEEFPGSPFDTLFAMLGFADVLGPRETMAVLENRRRVVKERLEQHPPDAENELRVQYGAAAAHVFLKSRALLTSELEWIDAVIDEVATHGWDRFRVPSAILDEPAGSKDRL